MHMCIKHLHIYMPFNSRTLSFVNITLFLKLQIVMLKQKFMLKMPIKHSTICQNCRDSLVKLFQRILVTNWFIKHLAQIEIMLNNSLTRKKKKAGWISKLPVLFPSELFMFSSCLTSFPLVFSFQQALPIFSAFSPMKSSSGSSLPFRS